MSMSMMRGWYWNSVSAFLSLILCRGESVEAEFSRWFWRHPGSRCWMSVSGFYCRLGNACRTPVCRPRFRFLETTSEKESWLNPHGWGSVLCPPLEDATFLVCLQLEVSCLQLGFFAYTYVLSFFTYNLSSVASVLLTCHATKRGATKRGATHKTTKIEKTQFFSTIVSGWFHCKNHRKFSTWKVSTCRSVT